jgi:hypothetical protein
MKMVAQRAASYCFDRGKEGLVERDNKSKAEELMITIQQINQLI